MKAIRIALVNNQKLIIKAIKDFLKKEREILIIIEACNCVEAIEKISKLKPDLIVSDLSMPDMDSFKFACHILNDHPHSKLLLLSSFQEDAYLNKARDMGISGYILKDNITDQLVEAIHFIAQGKRYFKGMVI